MKNLTPLLTAGLSATVLLTACGGGGGGDSTVAAGTLKVSLTDAPSCGFDNVFVTVSKVRVHKSSDAADTDAGWSEIVLTAPRKIDLLGLVNGKLEDLGQTSLPAGTYNQVRLVLVPNTGTTAANSVVPTGGSETALVTPSGVQSGIKLNGNFEVGAGATTDIALDFDACKSFVKRGNGSFSLKPVIRLIPMVASGAISGYVDKSAAGPQTLVSAQVNGVTVRSTVPDSEGFFSLSPLEAGTYVVVATGASRSTDVINAVPVAAKATTALSTSTAPLLTTVSTMGTLSGTVLPADAEGSVAAFQAISGGPVASIRYSAANATTGEYSLALPLAAPRYGQYSSTLPLTFATQGTLAGKYAVQAGAAGYQTQSVDIDLAGGNVTRNFTLVK
ncbi:DUF4382 domain-containing protein [Noviherbaspirillum denitrificans]|uniref:DUF4382 domain-containing protein n=1 Tax=Noviherbaspirillum denitrificans TaxID=1968433 RepID=A0A254TFV1_9BURK|nr:DUF4382 domain-containing protein [Noviherbaspirillum denitrificans]OWW21047.1 hypothetical protein AYR66_17780 [Noviherbaspirillum denitrificans]